jgi:hypothetical protein
MSGIFSCTGKLGPVYAKRRCSVLGKDGKPRRDTTRRHRRGKDVNILPLEESVTGPGFLAPSTAIPKWLTYFHRWAWFPVPWTHRELQHAALFLAELRRASSSLRRKIHPAFRPRFRAARAQNPPKNALIREHKTLPLPSKRHTKKRLGNQKICV